MDQEIEEKAKELAKTQTAEEVEAYKLKAQKEAEEQYAKDQIEMTKTIQAEAEKKAQEMHDLSVSQYIEQAQKEAADKAAKDKIAREKEIKEEAKKRAQSMTAEQVQAYIDQAEKEAAAQAVKDKAAAEKDIQEKAAALLEERMKEERENFNNRDFQRAMLDLGATFQATSSFSSQWNNPRLDGPYGWHMGNTRVNKLENKFPGNDLYYVNKFSFQKRGDAQTAPDRMLQYPTAIKIEYKDANDQWTCYEGCRWIDLTHLINNATPK